MNLAASEAPACGLSDVAERGQRLYMNALRRRSAALWKNFLDYAMICDLQTMESLLMAFEARCEDDGEALNLALCDVIYGCPRKQ